MKHKERGNKYQINCVKNSIISLESRGEDATFYRDLLKNWSHYEGWESATEALSDLTKSKSRPSKKVTNGIRPVEGK